MERRGKKRAQKRDLQRALLSAVAFAGLLALAAVPSNLPLALARLGMLPTGPKDAGTVNRARNRLIKKGLLTRTKDGFLRLTPAGTRAMRTIELQDSLLKNSRRWDGRWRVLIFDIPEKYRRTREKLRMTILSVGFVGLQGSVWVFPHDCEDFVALLKADLHIGNNLLYMIVDEMEADGPLRKHFGLDQ
ncbi:hypothetical protein HZC00_01255 [Candidatus Kaiserbacteria bacterium]|nr:hypothetical protein [Candidatus Kaiserbacteria bacterium]